MVEKLQPDPTERLSAKREMKSWTRTVEPLSQEDKVPLSWIV
jgi:hypothetical protein